MPKDDQPAARGTARARCDECGWTQQAPVNGDAGACDSCGSLKMTVSIPKQQRSKKQQF